MDSPGNTPADQFAPEPSAELATWIQAIGLDFARILAERVNEAITSAPLDEEKVVWLRLRVALALVEQTPPAGLAGGVPVSKYRTEEFRAMFGGTE